MRRLIQALVLASLAVSPGAFATWSAPADRALGEGWLALPAERVRALIAHRAPLAGLPAYDQALLAAGLATGTRGAPLDRARAAALAFAAAQGGHGSAGVLACRLLRDATPGLDDPPSALSPVLFHWCARAPDPGSACAALFTLVRARAAQPAMHPKVRDLYVSRLFARLASTGEHCAFSAIGYHLCAGARCLDHAPHDVWRRDALAYWSEAARRGSLSSLIRLSAYWRYPSGQGGERDPYPLHEPPPPRDLVPIVLPQLVRAGNPGAAVLYGFDLLARHASVTPAYRCPASDAPAPERLCVATGAFDLGRVRRHTLAPAVCRALARDRRLALFDEVERFVYADTVRRDFPCD